MKHVSRVPLLLILYLVLAGAASVLWASLHGICSLSDSGKLQVVSDQSVHEMAEMLTLCFVSGLQQLDERRSDPGQRNASP